MKKVLLIGNGAREHVICETLKRSPQEVEVYVAGDALNPGIENMAKEYVVGSTKDPVFVRDFALKIKPDFCIVGPEAPIALGVVDELESAGFKCCSPLKTVGRLESSKSFTRDLLAKYGIEGNPKFKVFTSEEGLESFLDELGENFVVKADGLKGGKGVKVSGDHLSSREEGLAYARDCLKESGRVIVEEKLIGQEFSLMSFCDGIHTSDMPAVQDHKRAYEGDKGPNTGGMGTYSDAYHSLPFLSESDISKASLTTLKVAKALHDETGAYFKGVMYGGFIAVKDGVRLIEYNARFGDPEAMNVLPLLKTNFIEICEAIINGTLDKLKVEFEAKATVCKYLVPNGYPENPCKGEKITVGEIPSGVKAYYASVNKKEDGLYLSGSRAIAFVGIADTIEEAEKLAESAVRSVEGPVFYRKDIGTRELIQKRVEHMRTIRSAIGQ